MPLRDVAEAGLTWPVSVDRAAYRAVIAWTADDERRAREQLRTDQGTGTTTRSRRLALLRAVSRTVDTHRAAIGDGRVVRFTLGTLTGRGTLHRAALTVRLVENDGAAWLSVAGGSMRGRRRQAGGRK